MSFPRPHLRLARWLRAQQPRFRFRPLLIWGCLLLCSALAVVSVTQASAQNLDRSLEQRENQIIRQFSLPRPPSRPPVAPARRFAPPPVNPRAAPRPAEPKSTARQPASAQTPASAKASVSAQAKPKPNSSFTQVVQFNRSPVVGNRLRLEGPFAETRLAFTRPADWNVKSAEAVIRFRHSTALDSSESNLTVRVNDTSLGSFPLNLRDTNIGEARVPVPAGVLQDANEIAIIAQHKNATQNCTSADDLTLWTEVLPDSQLVFQYEAQPLALDFGRYPRPFFDPLNLGTSHLSYRVPTTLDGDWLTAAARFSAHLGRLAEFRPLDQSLIRSLSPLQSRLQQWGSIVIIGTPANQPDLKNLDLPFKLVGDQFLDGNGRALPPDVGVLVATTTGAEQYLPVLVASGNGPQGVAKAVQALVQSPDRAITTGEAVLIDRVDNIPTPSEQAWPGYLPPGNSLTLADLGIRRDVSLRGSNAPPLAINFRALPSEAFDPRHNTLTVRYSYGAQLDPRRSTIEVLLDGVSLGSRSLDSPTGDSRRSLSVTLPGNLIQPDSQLQIALRMRPQSATACTASADQQLVGTIHTDTSFELSRYESFELPDLALLRHGFPFAAPQDLSRTTLVLPESPSDAELELLLASAERLGRLSQAASVKLNAQTQNSLTPQIQAAQHLIALGSRARFPLPEALKANASSFDLGSSLSRLRGETRLQTLPDRQGVIAEALSPWNRERVLLTLTAQNEQGLRQVREFLRRDNRFFQVQGDTVLIDVDDQIKILNRQTPRRIERLNWAQQFTRFLAQNWYLLPFITVLSALLLFGISHAFVQRALPGRESL